MRLRAIPVLVTLAFLAALARADQTWQPVGPDGGTVRSLALDPKNPDRIFLGTSAGVLYLSQDNGKTWARFARLGNSAEMVLDHIVIDPAEPKNIFVAAWNAQLPSSGDLFRSRDGGKTWEIVADLHGKSLRALSISASDSRVLVAGALDGIYRSRDGGANWDRISPANHAEIKNVESIAIDPVNPDVIYAGTWHLPWKTEDGGTEWHSIKKGVIDDSDVFSIVIDHAQPANLFISACSGIYRSESAGELFRKIQGIPYSARRTRILQMDPADHNVVYAGTTEGLWKTTDSGAAWKRLTGSGVVINDVLIDPRRPARVLLATDRGGVLASDDGGITFAASNRGFTHRQTAALLVDRNDGSIYAGLLSDKEYGGVFVSRDAGQVWKQLSNGLDGRDVFLLRQAADGSIIAGTDHGIFQLQPGGSVWIARTPVSREREAGSAAKRPIRATPESELNTRITALDVSGARWFAATATGFFRSTDFGGSWQKEISAGIAAPSSISVSGKLVAIAGSSSVAVSVNGGESWLPATRPLDPELTINSLAIDALGDIWLASRAGLFRSTDAGDSWKRISSLRLSAILSVEFDPENHRMLAVSGLSSNVFESTDNGRTWNSISSGWPLRNLRLAHGRLLGSTPFDGVVIQPDVTVAAESVAGNGAR